MRIIVTGGSGFLGSHIADALSAAGHEAVIFDLVRSRWLRPDQQMIIGSVLDPEAVIARCAAATRSIISRRWPISARPSNVRARPSRSTS